MGINHVFLGEYSFYQLRFLCMCCHPFLFIMDKATISGQRLCNYSFLKQNNVYKSILIRFFSCFPGFTLRSLIPPNVLSVCLAVLDPDFRLVYFKQGLEQSYWVDSPRQWLEVENKRWRVSALRAKYGISLIHFPLFIVLIIRHNLFYLLAEEIFFIEFSYKACLRQINIQFLI